MNRVPVSMLIIAVAISLVIGGIAGFFLGVASTEAGAKFLEDLVEQEQQAETGTPKKLVRERFELLYPTNWKIDVNDEDYDPDQMFSIDSPGSTFVMFIMGDMETNPEENTQEQINVFSKSMGVSVIDRFDTYGHHRGKGATLAGKLLGVEVTVKVFSCFSEGMTVIIVQQYPDEDLKYIRDGLELIEESFVLRAKNEQNAPDKRDAGDGK